MFEDLRAAFREALDNFNKELRRDQVPGTVDRLLVGMRNEIADEKAQVAALESQLGKAISDSAQERELGATCRRRERLALEIGDQETAALAAKHAVKHEGHDALLEKKAAAIREELEFRRKTVEEMFEKFSEAKQKRDDLAATSGRAEARGSFGVADDLFGELDRMAAKIESEDARGDAAEILASLDLDVDVDADYEVTVDEPPRAELDVDAALAELKRRMGKG